MPSVSSLCRQGTVQTLQPGPAFATLYSAFRYRQGAHHATARCCVVPRSHQQRYLTLQKYQTQYRAKDYRSNTELDGKCEASFPFPSTHQEGETRGPSAISKNVRDAHHSLLVQPNAAQPTESVSQELQSVHCNTMSGGGQAATAEHTVVAAPTAASVAAPPVASAHGVKTTVTAATVASGGASSAPSGGGLEESQQMQQPITDARLTDAIGTLPLPTSSAVVMNAELKIRAKSKASMLPEYQPLQISRNC